MSYIIISVLVIYLNGSIGKMKDYGISYLCSVYLWLWHLFMTDFIALTIYDFI